MSHSRDRADTLTESRLQLMQLPDELLAIICAHVEGSQYLCSLATVCRRLQHLAERLIYRSILIRTGGQAAALARAFDERLARQPCIRQLTVACKSDSEDGMLKLVERMPGLANLTSLQIESPENQSLAPNAVELWLAHQDRYQRMFQNATHLHVSHDICLQRLRSCTLHYMDKEHGLYPLGDHSVIFLHPTLQTLTVSCTYIDDPSTMPDFILNQAPATTGLKVLSLIECDMQAQGLCHLISLPRALESLTITETKNYLPRRYPDLTSPNIVTALFPQRSSLTHLSIRRRHHHGHLDWSDNDVTSTFEPSILFVSLLNLSKFTSLSHIQYRHSKGRPPRPSRRNAAPGTCSEFHNHHDRIVQEKLQKLAAPALQEMTYSDVDLSLSRILFRYLRCAIKQKELHGLASLKVMKIVFVDPLPVLMPEVPDEMADSWQKRQEIEKKKMLREMRYVGDEWRRAGVRLVVCWIRYPDNVIEPVLCGEATPSELEAYDTDKAPPLPPPVVIDLTPTPSPSTPDDSP